MKCLQLSKFACMCLFFGSCCVADFELAILSPECWDYSCMPPCPAVCMCFSESFCTDYFLLLKVKWELEHCKALIFPLNPNKLSREIVKWVVRVEEWICHVWTPDPPALTAWVLTRSKCAPLCPAGFKVRRAFCCLLKTNYFIFCLWVFFLNIRCVVNVCLLPTEARRWNQILWNWGCREL